MFWGFCLFVCPKYRKNTPNKKRENTQTKNGGYENGGLLTLEEWILILEVGSSVFLFCFRSCHCAAKGLGGEFSAKFLVARQFISPTQGPRHLDCLPQARGFRTGKNTTHQKFTLPRKSAAKRTNGSIFTRRAWWTFFGYF